MTSLRDLGERWLWGRTQLKSEPQGKVDFGRGVIHDTKNKKSSGLSPGTYRAIAHAEPMTLKGIRKKNTDTFRSWIVVKTRDGKDVPQTDKNILDNFIFDTKLKQKLQTCGYCSMLYGDGFIEKIYLEGKGKSAESAPPKNGRIIALKNLNSEKITERKHKTKDGVGPKYYVYKVSYGEDELIHPDRLIHIRNEPLPNNEFGTSVIQILRKILESKMNTDEATGELMTWIGNGVRTMKIDNMGQEDFDKMMGIFKEQPNVLVFDERFDFDIKNPTTIAKPEEYFNYFYTNIAAALVMPTHILTGIQPGHVTGSEIGISDYYNDVANVQELVFTPTLEDLFTEILKSRGRKWRYVIKWNPIFVDELSEGKIMEKRMNASMIGYTNKLVGFTEARNIIANGVIDINPDEKPSDVKEDAPIVPTGDANYPQPKKPVDKKGEEKEHYVVKPLSPASRMMIEQAKKEKELGEKELVEQERRVKEAKKRQGLSKTKKTNKKKQR